MDITTLAGIVGFGVFIAVGIATNQISSTMLNAHGAYMVLGGTLIAMLINTPLKFLVKSLTEIGILFREDEADNPEKLIPVIVDLAEQCRSRGMAAMRDVAPHTAGGFINRAATAALEYNDSQFVKQVMEQEINQVADEENEIANVYRSMSILAPMFGLLGTLIGIIGVLRDLANPETVGPAMSVAITSALYGIFFANMICVPIAGKIRARIWMKVKMKSMILDGVLEIMKGSIPMVVERRLQSYL
ncbi:MAG: MotA/TolQ/ExbB proton channel family protein [bacterium]